MIKNSTNIIPVDEIRDWYLIVWDYIIWIIWLDWIDFDMMSEQEKESVLRNYVKFLSSLPTPVQIYVSTVIMDIKKYMEIYSNRVSSLWNLSPKQKSILIHWMWSLLTSTVEQNAIIEKRFYLLVNMKQGDIPIENVFIPETETFKKKSYSDAEWTARKHIAEEVLADIWNKLGMMGLWQRRVSKEEIIELFKNEFRSINQTIESSPVDYVSWY